MIFIGIDLGGTRIKGIALNSDYKILQQFYLPTNDTEGNWKEGIADAVAQLKKDTKASEYVVGISAPGLPDNDNTAIGYLGGRLKGLENFIWQDFLKLPTVVLNDAIAALMAEAKMGAAKDSTNAVLLTLGTGVGGALLINKQPYQGSFNKAGHIGHMVIDCNAAANFTGMPGSLEDCIGNCTIEKRSDGKFTSTLSMLEAYKNGDEIAKDIWLTSVKKLAIGLASISNIISPDTIIIGGGIAEANDDLFIPLNKMVDEYEWQPGGIKAKIVKAVYGDLAGAIGAACFAKEKFKTIQN